MTGSLLRHVVVMSGSGAIGLLAMFAVDLINMIYIAHLPDRREMAAIGFAATLGFFQQALSIGLTVGVVASVSRALGARRRGRARRIAASGTVAMVAASIAVAALTIALRRPALHLLGAQGVVADHAARFLLETACGLPGMYLGMLGSGLLRCAGDARRSMTNALAGATASALLDPLLIYGLGPWSGWGLDGAAASTVLSRSLVAWLGMGGALRVHRLVGRPRAGRLRGDLRQIGVVAGPAIATNLATPFGTAVTTHVMARFGVAAVAGQVTIDRISIFAFGFVYALTGAVGPIIGQNLGAGRPERVRGTLRASFAVTITWVLGAWALLAAGCPLVLRAFSASGETAVLIALFCHWLAGSFIFTGSLFVANAAFNNLGRPMLATAFNWGRATLGTVPFVLLGARWGGAPAVLVGQGVGATLFGIAAGAVALNLAGRLHDGRTQGGDPQHAGVRV